MINNFEVIKFKLSDQIVGEGSIALKNELQVVDWVFRDSNGQNFNVDTYVPPVIPYAYDYLFTWQSDKRGLGNLTQDSVDLLYTIYENDTQHPIQLNAWIKRQEGIGKVLEQEKFGGITVERRTRI